MKTILSPDIFTYPDAITIVGSPEGLIALGEMLMAKGKLNKQMSATFTDGVNRPIRILTHDDILNNE